MTRQAWGPLRAVLAKEWTKAGRTLLLLLAGNGVAVAHVHLACRDLFTREHAEMVWYQAMQLGLPFFDVLRLAGLFTGAGLALAQFLPEMRDDRLRLTLHLPVEPGGLLLAHLAAGLAGLVACLVLQGAGLALAVATWFPREMVDHALATWSIWALAGVGGYLGLALTLLDPSPWRRAVLALLAAGTTWPLVATGGGPEAARGGVWLALTFPLLVLAVPQTAHRRRSRRTPR